MISIKDGENIYSLNERFIQFFIVNVKKNQIILRINPHKQKLPYSFDVELKNEEGKAEEINKLLCDAIIRLGEGSSI